PVPYLITAVIIVFIISAAAVAVSLMSEPEDEGYTSTAAEQRNGNMYTEEITEPETEAVTEAEQEVQPPDEEIPPAVSEPEIEPPSKVYGFDDSYSGYLFVEDLAYDLINPFYSYAWVQTTNNHDSSYINKLSLSGSPVRYTLGEEYWQERPTKSFNRIYNVQIHKISNVMWLKNPTCDTGFDVCISYSFELYDSETGKTVSKTELAIANVSIEQISEEVFALYMNKHTWVNDVPLGTTVTEDDFAKYLEYQ
ncbi:MAG: hypothetical protein LUH47_06935, partial [Clostridiales bacterium]|nr:hypothetical protein [Clostridiales bacterium]